MKFFKKPIFVSIAPNYEKDDVWLAFNLLLSPWLWIKGGAEKKFNEEFSQYIGSPFAFAFDSGRTSLYAILKSINLGRGDEVLVQAFNCTAAVNPILWVGAAPVYVDIERDTYNMSPADLKKKITPKSRALIIQHTFGFSAKLEELLAIAKQHNLIVIEDVAHSLGAEYSPAGLSVKALAPAEALAEEGKGRKLGTFGDASFFSFGRFKIISASFAGAAVANNPEIGLNLQKFYESMDYPSRFWIFEQLFHPVLLYLAKPFYNVFSLGKIAVVLAKKLRLISLTVYSEEKSGGRPGFGPSKMPNSLATLGLNQLKKIELFNEHRRELAQIYEQSLRDIPEVNFAKPLPNTKPVYLYFPIQFENIYLAYEIIGLGRRREGIYLENWPAKKVIGPSGTDLEKLKYEIGSCPVAEDAALKTIVLPTSPTTNEGDAKRVAEFVKSAFKRIRIETVSNGAKNGRIDIKEITDKKEWENFIAEVKPKTFLQSWQWGEFSKEMGHRVWHLGIYNQESGSLKQEPELAGAALVIRIAARRGTFLFVPHGPVFKNFKLKIIDYEMRVFTDYLKKLADLENCSFIRVSPLMAKTEEHEKLFKSLGFAKAPIHMQAAELVWMLDLSLPEEELLKNMRKTTRYLIRKSQGEKVEIVKSAAREDLEKFNKIYKETVARQRFVPYSEKFLEREFNAFSSLAPASKSKVKIKSKEGENIKIFLAKYNGEILAGAMIVYCGESAFYHQGASSGQYPKLQAPYLLQWEIIKDAKARGLKYYNFWGISPENKPNHPWAGLSLFKKGFGGFSEEYVPAQDLALRKSYWIAWLIEKARKIKRGL